MGFLASQRVNTIDWPSKSPDLNIMEDIWAQLCRLVYADGQFNSKAALIARIKLEGRKFDSKLIKKLYSSFYKRLRKVVEADGGLIER